MAISADTIIKKVRDLVGDQDDIRHPDAELLEYLNEAQRAAVLIRPEVNPVTEILTTETEDATVKAALDLQGYRNIVWEGLRTGTRQTIPTGGYVFISAIRNLERMGDGAEATLVPKRAATPTDQENLDQTDPNWHLNPGFTDPNVIINFVYDIRNRSVFYNYPSVFEPGTDVPDTDPLETYPDCYL